MFAIIALLLVFSLVLYVLDFAKKVDMRQSWDNYFMAIAYQVATRATCDRKHVGCVLVKNRQIISTGYNGSLAGEPHCDDIGHYMVNCHCLRTIHAEVNAVAQAARCGIPTDGAVAYVTLEPCLSCYKMLANAGISNILFAESYPDENRAGLYGRSEKLPKVIQLRGFEAYRITPPPSAFYQTHGGQT